MPTPTFRFHQARSRGVALILALAFLALLSVILVAFFMNVQTDLKSSNTYASGVTVKQLADTTTNIVMGQISDGTRGYEVPGHPGAAGSGGGGVADSGKRLAWVSQPGLIRTYDDTGLPGRSFKLYSSNNMVTAGGREFDASGELATEVPQDWTGQPALFTDLNRPVVVSETDPNTGQIASTPNYPILDPGALGRVDGFNITGAPGANATNAAPMPVRWMYVLADGALASPSNGNTVASFAGLPSASTPSKDNPIVGRVAFWTDDETCKLNINTASEGVFWDRPWADGPVERNLSATVPSQNEFHRYNGHPALTSLSPVFGSIFPSGAGGNDPSQLELMNYLGQGVSGKPQGLGLAPRVNIPTDQDANKVVRVKYERLYATVDELLFTPVVTGQERGTFNASKVNREFLEQSKFFLTTNSRAPDLNLAGKPRIGLWPIQKNTTERNAKDQLIAFCTTTGGGSSSESPYYFQRLSKYTGDGHAQYSVDTPSSQDPASDWTMIPRNQQIFAYLQSQTGNNIPGFGGNFLNKWGPDRDQVLAESFDYIRASLNSYNTSLDPKYYYLPSRDGYPHPGETQCIPVTVSGTPLAVVPEPCMGFGRYATITEAALVFFIANEDPSQDAKYDRLQAYLLMEPFTPSPGSPVWSPNVRFVVEDLDKFKMTVTAADGHQFEPIPMGFPEKGRSLVTSRVGYSGSGHKSAFMGLQALLRVYSEDRTDKGKLPWVTGVTDEVKYYPYISGPLDIFHQGSPIPVNAATPTKVSFSGGTIKINVYSGYEAAASFGAEPTKLIQTISMEFPGIDDLPLPTRPPAADLKFLKIAERIGMSGGTDINSLIRPTDVVRSVEASALGATKGDLRLQTALNIVDKKFFTKHPLYDVKNQPFAHSLKTSNGSNELFLRASPLATPPTHALETWLVANALYDPNQEPAAARGVKAALMRGGFPGDWDNGPGNIEDGAYINKADEGNLNTGYYDRGGFGVDSGASFSPNRQIASAVNFGSLPVGIKRTRDALLNDNPDAGLPWQTLLFCRYPAAGDNHTGRTVAPRDHLYLDLFTMPIVEPYAISEPFSTAGKVNLNYQIVPFTYINRSTAMRGVLKPVKITTIPKADARTYKAATGGGDYRRAINLDETLKGFDARFQIPAGANSIGDIGAFRSPSEICDMFLVPQNKTGEAAITLAKMPAFWTSYALTGDNAREAPYGQIYPRVTTRSNTFTVHMRVQSLRKSATTAGNVWDEGRDTVLGEYRGSTTIERFVDAGDSKIPDFAANPNATMDTYYRFRVLSTKRFAP